PSNAARNRPCSSVQFSFVDQSPVEMTTSRLACCAEHQCSRARRHIRADLHRARSGTVFAHRFRSPFGAIASIQETSKFDRDGMTYRGFAVEFATGKRVNLSTFTVPDGKIEQFLVEPVS
ncbi:MAG: hypothetical protein ABI311_00395, partial [Gemmatimonadaceae bacterium]